MTSRSDTTSQGIGRVICAMCENAQLGQSGVGGTRRRLARVLWLMSWRQTSREALEGSGRSNVRG